MEQQCDTESPTRNELQTLSDYRFSITFESLNSGGWDKGRKTVPSP